MIAFKLLAAFILVGVVMSCSYAKVVPNSVFLDNAVISFDNIGSGLKIDGDKLIGFTIAGEDAEFFEAEACIEDDKVIVTSDKVKNPIAVRYGWINYPVVNLFNNEGIPASPFRTDNFPLKSRKL